MPESFHRLISQYWYELKELRYDEQRSEAVAQIAIRTADPVDSEKHRRAVLLAIYQIFKPYNRPWTSAVRETLAKNGFDYNAILKWRIEPAREELTLEQVFADFKTHNDSLGPVNRTIIGKKPRKAKKKTVVERIISGEISRPKKVPIGKRLPKVRHYIGDIKLIPPGSKRSELIAHVCRLTAFNFRNEKIRNGYNHKRRVLLALHIALEIEPAKTWETQEKRLFKRGINAREIIQFQIPKCDRDLDYASVFQKAKSQ